MKPLHRLSREELYELVWSEAMVTLAPKFKISDVGCKKLGVPTPGLGYWAKLEAGKPVDKPPLPANWTAEKKEPKPVPVSKEEARKFQPSREDYTIRRPVAIVAETKKALRRAWLNHEGLRNLRDKGFLRTKLSEASINRGMWLWTELITQLKTR